MSRGLALAANCAGARRASLATLDHARAQHSTGPAFRRSQRRASNRRAKEEQKPGERRVAFAVGGSADREALQVAEYAYRSHAIRIA